jgi:hypothetical protein
MPPIETLLRNFFINKQGIDFNRFFFGFAPVFPLISRWHPAGIPLASR